MLGVDFAGLKLKNPFVIAAGPSSCDARIIKRNLGRIADAGWAGVVLKSIRREQLTPTKGHKNSPCIFPVRGRKGLIGMQNRGPGFTPFSDADLGEALKAGEERELLIIPSVVATNIEDWVYLTSKVEECGAKLVELDLSCPALGLQKAEAAFIDLDPQLAGEVVSAIKRECHIPMVVKLSPNLFDLSPVAKAVEEAGASGIAGVNTLLGLSGIDIETGIPLSASPNNKATFSGLSGEILKPVGLRCVAQIVKSVGIPVFGIGGISSWQAAVEYLMVGATALQVCTDVMLNGFKVVDGYLKGLANFMAQKGYKSISDFRGISLNYIVDQPAQLSLSQTLVVATVDETKCSGCGLCVTACNDGSVGEVITLENKKAIINASLCVACGLCKVVCPLGAIEFLSDI